MSFKSHRTDNLEIPFSVSNVHSKEIHVSISFRVQGERILSRATVWGIGQIRTKNKG